VHRTSQLPDRTASRNRVATLLLPDTITRWVRAMAWLSLIVNIGIVGTGGLVRLTGSGMGCETWPYCTTESLIPTPELGIHGLIEFGNRTLTGVLVIVAALMFLSVLRLTPRRPDLVRISFAIGAGIILQALVGGSTVWLHLHPSIVGFHFLLSAALVALATVLVYRVYTAPGPRRRAVGRGYAMLTHLTSAAVLVTVIVGVLLTGSGPHAGDDAAARNGLDPILWQHIHAWPGYVTFALTIALLIGAFRTPRELRLRESVALLLVVELVQIGVGLWQARTGLPIALVNIHMVLAVTLVAAMTSVVLRLKRPVPEAAPAEASVSA
jgi:cytochrome c oxidase assembly protein subunit 15